MSLPRPSGIKQPSRFGRPSGLPTTRPQTPANGNGVGQTVQNSRALSAIAKSARGAGFRPEQADSYADDVSKVLKGPEPLEDGFDSDDFKIGDRIWVNGNKPGIIAFIGDTQFAPGEWAGIVLDEPVGKNDGSVMGVRYFQCEAKRGVFSRLSKISRTPESPTRPLSQGYDSASSVNSDFRTPAPVATTNGASTTTSNVSSRPSSRLGLSSTKHLSTSSSSLHKATSAGTTPTGSSSKISTAPPASSLKVGDRVLVSGSKMGILRFVGETDFAKGVWAGVELDEPLGKNDGAVAGKRYFDCKPVHGLFAPIHKISLADQFMSTPSPHSRPIMSTSLRSSREHSGSQESVSSLSSTASSVSRSRVRLGVTSLGSQASKSGQRPNTLNLSATTAALQKALKEKEEHIEQLLRERDLERSEVARAAAHVDEAEGQLSVMKTEQSRLKTESDEQITKYRTLATDWENEKQELLALLEEEKRKAEDLQFQLEEETLRDDMDNKANISNEIQVKELERQVRKEKERSDLLEKELNQLKQKFEDQQREQDKVKAAQMSDQDKIQELTHQLAQAQTKIQAFESTRLEDGAKTSQMGIELAEKQNKVKELEDKLALQRREMSSMAQQLNSVKEELNASNDKRKKQDEHIKDLTDKLKQTENQHKDMMDEIRNANSTTADLQRQLTASKTKAEELAADKALLEVQLTELAKNSGDSSSQLATLTDQLRDRNRKIEALQNDLSNCFQNLTKSKEDNQHILQEKDKNIQEITARFQDNIVQLEANISDLNSSIEKSAATNSQLLETFQLEKTEELERRDREIRELQQQLANANTELGQQQQKTTAHGQLIDKLTLETETLQHEKLQVEKHLKILEQEKDAINTERIQARVEVTKCQQEVEISKLTKTELEDKVEKLGLQLEYAIKGQEEAEQINEELKSQKTTLVHENNILMKELETLKEEMNKKCLLLSEMQKKVELVQMDSSKKMEELMSKSQTETDHLVQELNSLKAMLQDTTDQLQSKTLEIVQLETQVEQAKTLSADLALLRKENAELVNSRDESEDKYRMVTQEVEQQSETILELQSEVQSLRTSEAALKKTNSTLEDKVNQLLVDLEKTRKEVAEAVSKVPVATGDQLGCKTAPQDSEDTEAANRQIEFLNSVIVELQNKNNELHHRLSIMEDSGIHTNGEYLEAAEKPARPLVPPRLYCDICEMFDLHETEDCPRQAMSDSPEPTHHHGDRQSTRPYCDICEVFGHATDQCDDEQTF